MLEKNLMMGKMHLMTHIKRSNYLFILKIHESLNSF